MNILVIAAHADDELIGVGGTILKYIDKGHDVYLCIATKGQSKLYEKKILKEKRKEAEKVAQTLGIKKVFFLNFAAAELDTEPMYLVNKKVSRIVEECRPYILYLPHEGDLHKDHGIIFYAGMVAARPFNNIKKILCYEVNSETEWSNPYKNRFIPNVYEDISAYLDKKLKILKLYKTEMKIFPHPRSIEAIKYKALQRGSEMCLKAAEAFILIREIKD